MSSSGTIQIEKALDTTPKSRFSLLCAFQLCSRSYLRRGRYFPADSPRTWVLARSTAAFRAKSLDEKIESTYRAESVSSNPARWFSDRRFSSAPGVLRCGEHGCPQPRLQLFRTRCRGRHSQSCVPRPEV